MTNTKDRKFYTVLAITLAIMLGFGYLPPFGQITSDGMRILGVFFGCIFAWTMGELIWSSILALILATLFGYGTMGGNYAAAYGNSTSAIMMAGLVFCYGIQACGLLREIAKKIVGAKWAQSPWGLLLAFYVSAVILAAMSTNFITPTIMLWALFYEIANELDLKPYSTYVTVSLIGIAICSCCGSAAVPYAAAAALVQGLAAAFDPAFSSFNAALFIVANAIADTCIVAAIMFVLKFIVRPKFEFEIVERPAYKMQFTKRMKVAAIYFSAALILMIFPYFFSTNSWVYQIFVSKLGSLGIMLLTSILMMVTRIDGKPVMDIEDALKNAIPWSLVLLISSALAISNYLTAEGMGILPTIIALFEPLVEGKSATVVIVIFMVVGVIMTNLINDIVTATVLYPIAAQFIVDAGGDLLVFTCLFTAAIVQGCFMPSGSAIGAMMHGNTEWLKPKDVYKYVAILEIVVCIILGMTAGIFEIVI